MTRSTEQAAAGPAARAPAPGEPRLVAIVAVGRNGSTLLQQLLDGSDGLYVHASETNYLCAFDELARRGRLSPATVANATTRELTGLDRAVPADRLLATFRAHWAEIETDYAPDGETGRQDAAAALLAGRSEFRADEFLPLFLDATRRIYEHRGGDPGLFVFKTLETPYVDEYARVFASMRFLHVIRDPVQNFASIKRTWIDQKGLPFYHGGADILRMFLDARWVPHARLFARPEGLDPERHLLVRYEDLVAAPEERLREIFAWLGAPPPAEPTEQTALGGRPLERIPQTPSEPGVEPPRRIVRDMASEFGYRDVVAPRERDLIGRCAGDLAARLGYEEPARLPGGRVRAWLRWLPVDASERIRSRSRLRWMGELLRRRVWVAKRLAGARTGR